MLDGLRHLVRLILLPVKLVLKLICKIVSKIHDLLDKI